jgi:uncharacterized protein YndB with AHSA1/START domain
MPNNRTGLNRDLLQGWFKGWEVCPINPSTIRVPFAQVTIEIKTSPETFFAAFSSWAGYESWAPEVQGPGHWLLIKAGGPGSKFILYDKPGKHHLAHFGVVTELDRARRFSWRAPFSEWNRAYIGTTLEVNPKTGGGSRVTETLFFDLREDLLPVLAGFSLLSGLDPDSMMAFLEARLRGLDRSIQAGKIHENEMRDRFTQSQVIAADWANRISEGEWVRILYADGEVDFPAPPDLVFNAFTRWSRYADWTRDIHVGAEWHTIRQGGMGSRFLLWEKPGDRHVMHYGSVIAFERNRRFAWRAPMAEWNKVWIGTDMRLTPRPDGGTHGYHVLTVDMPFEYLAVFGGFGRLHGFDLEFETFHIQEEAQGFNRILRSGGFSKQDQQYLFDENRVLALDVPMEAGRPYPYPDEVLTLKADRVLTYEEAAVVTAEMLAEAMPSPRFFRKYRDQKRTRRFNQVTGERS